MSNFESWMLGYLVNSLWLVPLVFGVAWLAARVVRASGAAMEHRVLVGALVLQCVLPGLPAGAWEWLKGLAVRRDAAAANGHVTVVLGTATGVATLHFPARLLMIVAMVYGAVVVYFAARLVWGLVKVMVVANGAADVELGAEAAGFWARCSERFGVGAARLATSARAWGPMTMGIWRPVIVLPDFLLGDAATEDLETAMAHELAHVSRQDYAKNLLYEVLALAISYHPVYWATRARVIESREMICDRMAAEAVAGQEKYARSLLRLAALVLEGKPVRVAHAIGIFDANGFERRVMRLMTKQVEMTGVRRIATVAVCVGLGLGTCASALALRTGVAAPELRTGRQSDGATKVSAGVMAGNIQTKVTPKYPQEAKDAKVQGAVVLKALIGKDGTIKSLQLVSGPSELAPSAWDAVKQWVYKPYLLNGEPVEVETTITVNYSLAN